MTDNSLREKIIAYIKHLDGWTSNEEAADAILALSAPLETENIRLKLELGKYAQALKDNPTQEDMDAMRFQVNQRATELVDTKKLLDQVVEGARSALAAERGKIVSDLEDLSLMLNDCDPHKEVDALIVKWESVQSNSQ